MIFNAKKYVFIGLSICIIGLSTCFIFNSCNKSTTPNPNATGYVNQYLDLTLVQYFSLTVTNGFYYIPLGTPGGAGVKGIVVICKSPGNYVAYDRNCTYTSATTCTAPIIMDPSNAFYLTDSCKSCGSKFLITDGSVIKSPATVPLVHYQTAYDPGTQQIHIFN